MTDAEKIVLSTVSTTIFKESVFNLHNNAYLYTITAGVSSLGVPGVPWHTQILANQLTLSQPGGQIMPT